MTARKKNRGLSYLRRSGDRQETSLRTQVEWACGQANNLNVNLLASPTDVEYAQAHRLHSYKDIRLDDSVTGADLTRPGFLALINDAHANPSISHLFIFKRDRFARPEDAIEMVSIERKLLLAGITIVFSGEVSEPMQRGQDNLARDFTMLFGYYESGGFLNKLAERVLLAQKLLALQGYRTGGNPPYGFVRVLVDASGKILEELALGRRVRQEGCHVRIVAKDQQKIAVWLHILELKHKGWGNRRIAKYLNDLGIPSPAAGTVRIEHGVQRIISGKWSQTTIRGLCKNRAILGLQDFGRRSEGAHRRLSEAGPRLLTDADRNENDRPKSVANASSVIVTAAINTPAQFDVDRWEAIKVQQENRGKSQRGIPRTKDLARYPLSCRIVDLTDDCGSVMYGRTHRAQPVYSCGRYMSTAGAECRHNVVDGEAMLRFTLKSIRQLLGRHGNKEKLRQLLLERARRETPARVSTAAMENRLLTSRCDELRNELQTVKHRMAREKDDSRYSALAEEFDRIKAALSTAEKELQVLTSLQPEATPTTPENEVNAAMGLIQDIQRITSDSKARGEINPLLVNLGVRIGLTFGDAIKGKKRVVRRLLCGVMTFGKGQMPVRPHGRDRDPTPSVPKEEDGYCREMPAAADSRQQAETKTHQEQARTCGRGEKGKAGKGTKAPNPTSSAHERAARLGISHPEGISFTKGSRGEPSGTGTTSTTQQSKVHTGPGASGPARLAEPTRHRWRVRTPPEMVREWMGAVKSPASFCFAGRQAADAHLAVAFGPGAGGCLGGAQTRLGRFDAKLHAAEDCFAKEDGKQGGHWPLENVGGTLRRRIVDGIGQAVQHLVHLGAHGVHEGGRRHGQQVAGVARLRRDVPVEERILDGVGQLVEQAVPITERFEELLRQHRRVLRWPLDSVESIVVGEHFECKR